MLYLYSMQSIIGDYYDCTKDDDIQMEPRLTEYIKTKKYYHKNRISTDNLEKKFDITKNDMIKIRSYLRGDKKYINENKDLIDVGKASFPSESFEKDARMDRIVKKQQKTEEAKEQKNNYGLISRGFDMYRSDRPFASAMGDDFSKSKFNPNQWFEDDSNSMRQKKTQKNVRFMEDTKMSNYKNPNRANVNNTKQNSLYENNTYVHPQSTYNGYVGDNTVVDSNMNNVKKIIGDVKTYRNKIGANSYQTNRHDTDDVFGDNNPFKRNKCEAENNYMNIPLQNGFGQNDFGSDIEVDTYMRFGDTPSRGAKSLGYPNPVDHYFDFISNDLQTPEHTMSMRGVASRLSNTEIARPENKRRIMK